MREPEHPVDKIFLERHSPRAFSGEEISDEELMTLFEAAKWAPSSFNGQPWRFIYAKRNTEYWDKIFNLMMEGNQSWAKNASVLVVIISRKTFEHNDKPSKTHTFDTGSAWMSLALQASMKGLITHGMEGFDYDKAKEDLKIPDNYQVEAMIAIGKLGDPKQLPEQLQKMEAPNNRKKLSESVFEGEFKG